MRDDIPVRTWMALSDDVTPDHLGLIPSFLDDDDPRPAAEQLHANYAHGGGWQPDPKWRFSFKDGFSISYPGDEPLKPYAWTMLHRDSDQSQAVFIYPYGIVGVWDKPTDDDEGHFEAARMD